jgi:hypothetical protein
MLTLEALGTREEQSMRTTSAQYWTLASTIMILAAPIHAAIIDDASFFDDIPHTFVDFETRDDGSPLPLTEGQSAFAPLDEYAKLGFSAFSMNIAWEWSADRDVQEALTAGATPTNLLRMFPNRPSQPYGFFFAQDQRSVGLFVTRETLFASEPMTITMVNRQGELVETVSVFGDHVDGMSGSIEYGYVGVSSAEEIAGVIFNAPNIFAFGIDDFRFSLVPEPGALIPLTFCAAFAQRRRR